MPYFSRTSAGSISSGQAAHRQRLLHQPEQRRVGQSRGQGINGQNAPGGHGWDSGASNTGFVML